MFTFKSNWKFPCFWILQVSKLTVSGKNNRVLTFYKDGERGLVITNRKPVKDMKIDEVNIKQQIENQDRIIEVLKEKLDQTEMKLSETVKAFHDQEFENKKLIEENHANLHKIQQLEKYHNECISQKSDIEFERAQLLQYKLKSESQNNETIPKYNENNEISCDTELNIIIEQNHTIISLKDQIQSQMNTLSGMNEIISMLRKILDNLRQRIKADDNVELITKMECLKKGRPFLN